MATLLQSEKHAKLKKVFSDDTSFTAALFIGALHYYGVEMLGNGEEPGWTPETILMEIDSDFGIHMSQGCFDRLMAGIVVATTDMFYNDLPTFIHICNVMSGSPIGDEFDPASVLEMTWAITESNLLNLDPGEEPVFSPDIKEYIVHACKEEGIVNPPWVLSKVIADVQQNLAASSFTDQPDLFEGVWYNQQVNVIDAQIVVQSNLWKLYEQLKSFEDVEEIKKKLTELQQKASVSIQQLRQQANDLAAG